MKKLTIAIPTYERKERLKQQINSLLSQKESDQINILVCDNNSSYDVKSFISEDFGDASNIEVDVNKLNVGGGANIAMTFLKCKTPWMWLLGDDDETTPRSISTILNNIELHPDVAFMKYSIQGFKAYENKVVESLEDFIDYYHYGKYQGGDMIFISNNVYNLGIINKYYKDTLLTCFCRVAQLIPVFNILSEKGGKVMFHSFPIVNYQKPEKGTAWNMLKISVGISILPLLNYNLDKLHYHRLMEKIGGGFPHGTVIRQCLNVEERSQRKYMYHHIYNALYKHSGVLKDKILFVLFHILYIIGFKFKRLC